MENTNLSDSLTGSFYLLKISQLAELMKITLKLNPKLNITNNNNYNNPQTVGTYLIQGIWILKHSWEDHEIRLTRFWANRAKGQDSRSTKVLLSCSYRNSWQIFNPIKQTFGTSSYSRILHGPLTTGWLSWSVAISMHLKSDCYLLAQPEISNPSCLCHFRLFISFTFQVLILLSAGYITMVPKYH